MRIRGIAFALSLCVCPLILAADGDRAWTNSTEFAFVNTAGNSESSSFGFGNTFTFKWPNAEYKLQLSALRNSSTEISYSNAGGSLVEEETEATTAENYAIKNHYKQTISVAFYWYALLDWDKDRFAGISSRYRAGAGAGYIVFADDLHKLVLEAGLDYSDEERVEGTTESDLQYGGVRAFAGYERKVGASSKFEAQLEVLDSLEDTSDIRANLYVALTATMTQHFALKASYEVKYDAVPVEELLFDPADPDGDVIPAVIREFDKTDTVFKASLVVNF